jgi:cytoskeleton protein RodZ
MNDELSPGSGTSGSDATASPAAGPETEPPVDAGPPTAGGLIRAARQAQGLDLASLAAMLKIPLRKLEALEGGRHEELQGPTFERALAQAACRVLKMDPRPVLALMPQVAGNTLEHVTGGLNKPFRERQARAEIDGATLLRPVVVLPLLIVAAALALFFVPDSLWKRVSQPVTAALSGDGATPAASAPAAAGATPVSPAPFAAASQPAQAPVAAAPAAPAPVAATAPVAASAPAASGVDEVLAHAAPPPTIPLQVSASADSWVEVLDAQGHTLLSRTVVSGESVGLDGAMPMRIKVGNARGTKLTLRGDNVDLTQYTRDNVARLELK